LPLPVALAVECGREGGRVVREFRSECTGGDCRHVGDVRRDRTMAGVRSFSATCVVELAANASLVRAVVRPELAADSVSDHQRIIACLEAGDFSGAADAVGENWRRSLDRFRITVQEGQRSRAGCKAAGGNGLVDTGISCATIPQPSGRRVLEACNSTTGEPSSERIRRLCSVLESLWCESEVFCCRNGGAVFENSTA
jgi:hypothetical protein